MTAPSTTPATSPPIAPSREVVRGFQADPPRAIGRELLAALGKTGGASVASGLMSALAAKIVAAVAGPVAVAWLVTFQQLRQTLLVVSTGNAQTALVRATGALDGVRRREFLRTSACIFAVATGVSACALLAAPSAVARFAGVPAAAAGAVRWLAVPLVFSSVFVFLGSLLNGLGKIGSLSALQIAAAAAMAAGAWPAAAYLRNGAGQAIRARPEALAALLGLSAAVGAAGAGWALHTYRSEWQDWIRGPGRIWSAAAARLLASLSLAMLASGVAASAALLLVREKILSTQGWAVTGQFDAAWAISMNHVTLVLASLQTYYLPALARARTAASRDQYMSSVLATAAVVAALLIAAVAALKPLLLTWFYSSEFRPGAQYLRWTLLGDYLKVSSWILSIPLLAAAEWKIFLAADLAASAVFLGAARGLQGTLTPAVSAAAAFVLMYAAHLLICAVYWIRFRGYVPTRSAVCAWSGGLAVVLAVSRLTWDQQ